MEEANKLKRRKDFSKTYKRGKSLPAQSVVLCYRKNSTADFRVGFTVSKKVGNAVVRNKVRRRMKEVARLHSDRFPAGYDCIFVARRSADKRSYDQVKKEMLFLLSRISS